MGLRNILLFISVIIVGFCLSLYFQTANRTGSVNWEQYQNIKTGDETSHSLKEFDDKITPLNLEGTIQEIFEKNRLAGEKTRVMEIGPGDGRVLMELKKKFPEVEFYGINKEKTHHFYRRESFIHTGLKYEIFNRDEIEQIELPFLLFVDLDFGTRIPYDKNKFDVVYSQNVMPFIKYKFEMLNEVMRILKIGGLSVHADVKDVLVYSDGVVLEWKDALGELRRRGINIKPLENPTSIMFKKTSDDSLFPVLPHQPIPSNLSNLSQELRRPDMGYNLQ